MTRPSSTTADVGVGGLRAARRADRARVAERAGEVDDDEEDEVGGDEEDGVGEPRAVAGAAAARDKAGAAAEERHGERESLCVLPVLCGSVLMFCEAKHTKPVNTKKTGAPQKSEPV